MIGRCAAGLGSSVPCYSPLRGFRSRVRAASGKRTWVSNPVAGFGDRPLVIPCGQCVGCRLERARQWAVRCVHEASLYEENAFVTLTYADEWVPDYGSLRKTDFQQFMKRLRKRYGSGIRFFHCGEYGSVSKRPHYHALLFGFDFPDKTPWTSRNGLPVWRSAELELLWPFGLSEIGSVTFESASYVARYVVEKVTGERAKSHYERVDGETGEVVRIEPEYCTMSRRPGIGRGWIEKFAAETYRADSVVVRGYEQRPPRYYDGVVELSAEARARRKRKAKPEENTEERLAVREEVRRARLRLTPKTEV